tara:strand:+ start:3817 stop:4341 length:525 start_codon:yes stop_codon:yes gene_type:complete
MHNFFKKYYFINRLKKNNIDKLDNNTEVIFRNYHLKNPIIEIIKVRDYCKKKGIKIYLANDIKLALKLKLDGAYLPSFYMGFRHLAYSLRKKFLLIGSAHNLKEIRYKETQCVEYIFISSLFKRNKNYLGAHKFISLKKLTKRKIIALGGISEENLKQFRLTKCIGFSGIRYFE